MQRWSNYQKQCFLCDPLQKRLRATKKQLLQAVSSVQSVLRLHKESSASQRGQELLGTKVEAAISLEAATKQRD
jgi:hypothetical protein